MVWILSRGSKAFPPSARPRHFRRAAHHELVDDGALFLRRAQQPTHALDVLPRSERAAHDDGHVRVGHIEPLVQHARGYERTKPTFAKAREHVVSLRLADVAGDGHDQVVARDGVRGGIVLAEHEHSRVYVARQQSVQDGGFGLRIREPLARTSPAGERATSRVTSVGRLGELGSARFRERTAERDVDRAERSHIPLVGVPLGCAQLDLERDVLVAREPTSGELVDAAVVYHGTQQLLEPGERRIVVGRCRREAEPRRGHGHFERLVAQAASEVARLVDHQHFEPTPDARHVAPCALECGDGYGRERAPPLAEHPHGAAIARFERGEPLMQRVGTRHGVGNAVVAIAASATCVLPLPVGSDTTPCRFARFQASAAAAPYRGETTKGMVLGGCRARAVFFAYICLHDTYRQMRTTLNLDDRVAQAAKRYAEQQDTTLTAVVDAALRQYLSSMRRGRREFRLDLHVRDTGPRAGVNLEDRDALYDLMEDRR